VVKLQYKTVFSFILGILLIFSLTGCVQLGEPVADTEPVNWGLTLSVKDVTPISLTLVYANSGGEPSGQLRTGEPYELHVLRGGTWYHLKPRNGEINWTTVAYLLSGNSSWEHAVNWESLYGRLPSGTYRIGKEIMDYRGPGDYDAAMHYAEFVIE